MVCSQQVPPHYPGERGSQGGNGPSCGDRKPQDGASAAQKEPRPARDLQKIRQVSLGRFGWLTHRHFTKPKSNQPGQL